MFLRMYIRVDFKWELIFLNLSKESGSKTVPEIGTWAGIPLLIISFLEIQCNQTIPEGFYL